MQVNILNSKLNSKYFKGLSISEENLHPCKPFYHDFPNLKPESVKRVYIKGVLEGTRYIKYVLKIADSLLKLDGELEIDFFNPAFDTGSNPFRDYSGLMYEISICFKERLKLEQKKQDNNILNLRFRKILPTLPEDDTICSWSFGLISDGRKNLRILQIIDQLKKLNIPNLELLICGPKPNDNLPSFVRVLPDDDLKFDIRAPISKKKNRIIENAKYNNLVLFHDRFSFPSDWYTNLKKYGNYFDGLSIRILDEETQKSRVQDWIGTSLDHYNFKRLFPKRYKLKYDEWIPNWNVNGGFMIVKKHLIERVKLNPFLHWGESEDGDLCRRLDADGFCLTFYHLPKVTTQTHRLKISNKRRSILYLAQVFKRNIYHIIHFYKRKKEFNTYLRNN